MMSSLQTPQSKRNAQPYNKKALEIFKGFFVELQVAYKIKRVDKKLDCWFSTI